MLSLNLEESSPPRYFDAKSSAIAYARAIVRNRRAGRILVCEVDTTTEGTSDPAGVLAIRLA